MATSIEATFDGQVFRPTGPVALPPNTCVRLIIERLTDAPVSFLRTDQSLKLEGPPDWASNLDAYLQPEAAVSNGQARQPAIAHADVAAFAQ